MHPVFIKIGNFVIYWYGVMVAVGVFLSSFLFSKYATKCGYSQKVISEIVFWIVIIGIIGGRLFHIIAHFSYYHRHPFEILRIRNGGLSVQGAIFSSLLFLVLYLKIKRMGVMKMLDMLAVFVPLGQAIGRIGCFLNGCCYGKPTNFFLGVKFPFLEEKVHPTQLYYTFLYFLLFFGLYNFTKKERKDGEIVAVYLLSFGLIRYLVDFLRGDLLPTIFGLTLTQLLGIFTFMVGSLWLSWIFIRVDSISRIK